MWCTFKSACSTPLCRFQEIAGALENSLCLAQAQGTGCDFELLQYISLSPLSLFSLTSSPPLSFFIPFSLAQSPLPLPSFFLSSFLHSSLPPSLSLFLFPSLPSLLPTSFPPLRITSVCPSFQTGAVQSPLELPPSMLVRRRIHSCPGPLVLEAHTAGRVTMETSINR